MVRTVGPILTTWPSNPHPDAAAPVDRSVTALLTAQRALAEQSMALRKKSTSSEELMLPSGGSDRRRSGDLSIFSRTLYQLSYRA